LKNRSCDKLINGFNCFYVLQCRSRTPARHVVALHYRNQVICCRPWAYAKGQKRMFAVGKSISTHESDEVPDTLFFPDGVDRSSRAPDPRFRPGLGLHPSGEPRPSSSFRGALGDSGRKKRARNGEENSRASFGPDLSARVGGRRPHRFVFRASSPSPRIVFRAL
jgi:hypothetical protein